MSNNEYRGVFLPTKEIYKTSFVPEMLNRKIPEMSSLWVYMVIGYYRYTFVMRANKKKLIDPGGDWVGLPIKRNKVIESDYLFDGKTEDRIKRNNRFRKLKRAHKELVRLGLLMEDGEKIFLPKQLMPTNINRLTQNSSQRNNCVNGILDMEDFQDDDLDLSTIPF